MSCASSRAPISTLATVGRLSKQLRRFSARLHSAIARPASVSSAATQPSGTVRAGDGETLRRLVLEGVGIGQLSLHHIRAALEAGRLVPLLESFNPGGVEPIHAVCLGKAGRLPARVRAVLEFLVANAGAEERAIRPARGAKNASAARRRRT